MVLQVVANQPCWRVTCQRGSSSMWQPVRCRGLLSTCSLPGSLLLSSIGSDGVQPALPQPRCLDALAGWRESGLRLSCWCCCTAGRRDVAWEQVVAVWVLTTYLQLPLLRYGLANCTLRFPRWWQVHLLHASTRKLLLLLPLLSGRFRKPSRA